MVLAPEAPGGGCSGRSVAAIPVRFHRPQRCGEGVFHVLGIGVAICQQVPKEAVRSRRQAQVGVITGCRTPRAHGIQVREVRVSSVLATHESACRVPGLFVTEHGCKRSNVDVVLRGAVVLGMWWQPRSEALGFPVARSCFSQRYEDVLCHLPMARRCNGRCVVRESKCHPGIVTGVNAAIKDGIPGVLSRLSLGTISEGGGEQRQSAPRGDLVIADGVGLVPRVLLTCLWVEESCEGVEDASRLVHVAALREVNGRQCVVIGVILAAAARAWFFQLAQVAASPTAQGFRPVGPQKAILLPRLVLEIGVHKAQNRLPWLLLILILPLMLRLILLPPSVARSWQRGVEACARAETGSTPGRRHEASMEPAQLRLVSLPTAVTMALTRVVARATIPHRTRARPDTTSSQLRQAFGELGQVLRTLWPDGALLDAIATASATGFIACLLGKTQKPSGANGRGGGMHEICASGRKEDRQMEQQCPPHRHVFCVERRGWLLLAWRGAAMLGSRGRRCGAYGPA
mmetsp:Transcript_42449/g.90390  ORF Transcript_42449/g.90390 Transcript_42449/m.90390 type:complete len:517 (-) Transcript_42449:40-1590(-)